VRCLVRRPEFLSRARCPRTDVVQGDVLKPESLPAAFEGVATTCYLVHSMGAGPAFEEEDRRAARNFGEAARGGGVRNIIYLGGLGVPGEGLSARLSSRLEVGELLRAGGVPVIEFRASVIIGSGSLSFEIIRALVERLPVMVAPRWVSTPPQPIAIEDVIACLVAALELPGGQNRVYEIGGVRNPTLVQDAAAARDLTVRPMGIREAIARALRHEDREFAETRWSDALSSGRGPRSWAGARVGSRIVDSRTIELPCPPAQAFLPVRRIGGQTGWYYANWLWRIRGLLDSLAGGVGLRRGRRDPETPRVGDTLDFWRVEAYAPDRRLRLHAEMRLPGRAWLEFEVTGDASGSILRQTAVFDPSGLAGLIYWYGLYPLHRLIFAGMLERIRQPACQ